MFCSDSMRWPGARQCSDEGDEEGGGDGAAGTNTWYVREVVNKHLQT